MSAFEAQNITHSSATISGEVNDENVESTDYFEYISNASYQAALAQGVVEPYENGEKTPLMSIGASTQPQTIAPLPVSGLLPGETYYYRLIAGNPFGEIPSKPGMFTTLPSTPPLVSTGGVGGVSQTSATLTGTVTTNGLATEYGFEISTIPGNFGPATGLGSVGGAQSENGALTLSELRPGTTYYYRVTASNGDGTDQGAEQSFTTVGLPNLFTVPATPPLYTGYQVPLPKEEKVTTGTTTKMLTNTEKLSKALKVCKREKSKGKRQKCEKQAHAKYPTSKKKKASRKK